MPDRTPISTVIDVPLYLEVNLDGTVYLRRADSGHVVVSLSFDDVFDADGNRFEDDTL